MSLQPTDPPWWFDLAHPEASSTDEDEDVQCRRCGSSMGWEDCHDCGGEGEYPDGWDDDFYLHCAWCHGSGGSWWCLSKAEWCEANPLPGREGVDRHTEEWFRLPPTEVSP